MTIGIGLVALASAWLVEPTGVHVTEAAPQVVEGPQAELLLQALPPADTDALGFATAEQLQKHFRSLTLSSDAGPGGVEIQCSSAQWIYTGGGRVGQYKLYSDVPKCTLSYVADTSGTVIGSIADALAKAAAANAIEAPLPPPPVRVPPFGCQTRLCGGSGLVP